MANAKIVIDDGSKVYDIVNKLGQVLGQFIFRPSDTNIAERAENVLKAVDEYKPPEGGDESEKGKALEKFLVDQMSYAINADAQEAFFSIQGPLSPLTNGITYWEHIMDSIGKIIEKEFDVRLKKAQTRVNKYTQKYHK